MKWRTRDRSAAWLLVSSYIFGAIVLAHNLIGGFVLLTPLHLLFVLCLLVWTHRPLPDSRLPVWLLAAGLFGYLVEVVGVATGWPFGNYSYGQVLGPGLWGVPLVLAINWALVSYSTCTTVAMYCEVWPKWLQVAISTIALVLLDVLIEPVAISLGFWTWEVGIPPLLNYLGWASVGLVEAVLFFWLIPYSANRLAPIALILQVAFFTYLSLA